MQQAGNNKTPSPGIIIPHFVFGMLALLSVTVLIIIYPGAFTRHFFNPQLLSITHLLVLGWITMLISGVLYQLIPVILDVKLYSEKLALGSFVSLALGSILLAVAFMNFRTGLFMEISAGLVILAVILLAINIFITAKSSAKDSIQKNFILTAIVWLLFTVSIGLMLAINLSSPFLTSSHIEFLKLHAHAGIVGWFLQLIMGVGSRLLPMFMVSHHLDERKLKLAYVFINAGLVCGIVSLYMQWNSGVSAGVFLGLVGLANFLAFVIEAYRKRVKKQLDIGMKQSLASFVVLLLPVVLVILLTSGVGISGVSGIPVSVAYGSAILLGFVTSLMMGQTFKILPFVVWLRSYRHLAGKPGTPLPKDLFSERRVLLQSWIYAGGLVLLICGILLSNDVLVRVSGAILCEAVLLYNVNVYGLVLGRVEVFGRKPFELQQPTKVTKGTKVLEEKHL